MDYEQLSRESLRLIRSIDRCTHSKRSGIGGEVFVLDLLSAQDAPYAPGKIAEMMQVSTARVAALLRSLEAKGFLVRSRQREDKRRIGVSLTKEGEAFLQRQKEKLEKNCATLFCSLGPKDACELVRLLARVEAIVTTQKQEKEAPSV